MALGMVVAASVARGGEEFVRVRDGGFVVGGKPYVFVGANFWQGMNLGVEGAEGDRERLTEELDRLARLGVTNLRVMAASEGPNGSPQRMAPALMVAPGEYDERVFAGLDFLIAEAGKRDLRLVMVLNNFWHWSGGMAQYVAWAEGTAIPYPTAEDWDTFAAYAGRFYGNARCQAWYRAHVAAVVNRVNGRTGRRYRDDPAIFAWELANEPRRYPAGWIEETAGYIKSLDPNHLVTTGSEGQIGGDFAATHAAASIDYATVHIWPQNWGWYDPRDPATYAQAEAQAVAYLREHLAVADRLKKPLVLEEFGLARDWAPPHDLYAPAAPTTHRDRFYAALLGEMERSRASGEPAWGSNFWAWAGRPGAWPGDPPHEPAGWYSVYATDASTLAVIAAHAEAQAKANSARP